MIAVSHRHGRSKNRYGIGPHKRAVDDLAVPHSRRPKSHHMHELMGCHGNEIELIALQTSGACSEVPILRCIKGDRSPPRPNVGRRARQSPCLPPRLYRIKKRRPGRLRRKTTPIGQPTLGRSQVPGTDEYQYFIRRNRKICLGNSYSGNRMQKSSLPAIARQRLNRAERIAKFRGNHVRGRLQQRSTRCVAKEP